VNRRLLYQLFTRKGNSRCSEGGRRRATGYLVIVSSVATSLLLRSSELPSHPKTFRPYVLKAVALLYGERKLGGDDMSRRFTKDLHYGGQCCIYATRPVPTKEPYPTMCVAAVVETMVEALNIYGRETGDSSYTQEFPLNRIDGDTITSLIPNVFKYSGANSSGTGYALATLGLGRELSFDQLQPGDFVSFNRKNNTGHAVIFMGFITKDGNVSNQQFSASVVGFRYFSAQGQQRKDGGFGYRNAYLTGKCPIPKGQDDDCDIIGVSVRPDGTVSQSSRLFNSGEMFSPDSWDVRGALDRLRSNISRGYENEGLSRGTLEDAIQFELTRKLQADSSVFRDGTQ
jgi:hypothetical protein